MWRTGETMMAVRDETFYATTAQVIPTLLIAFVIEGALLTRRATERMRKHVEDVLREADPKNSELAQPEVVAQLFGKYQELTVRLLTRQTALIGSFLLFGETASCGALLWGNSKHSDVFAIPLCLLSVLGGTLALLLMPLRRARADAAEQRAEFETAARLIADKAPRSGDIKIAPLPRKPQPRAPLERERGALGRLTRGRRRGRSRPDETA